MVTAHPAERAARRPTWLSEYWSAAVAPYLLQRLFLSVAVYFCAELIGTRRVWHALPHAPFFDAWIRWDSYYYLLIASDGYGIHEWGSANPFFPLYPALIVAFGLALPLPFAALLVSNLCAVAALCLLYAWVRDAHDAGLARRAVQIAIVFPTSFFLTAAYSEPVFLLAAMATVYAASRGKQLGAAAAAVAGCLARPVGLMLGPPALLQWVVSSRRLRDFPWFAAGAAVGAALVLLVYRLGTGDAFAFVHAPQVETLGRYVGKASTPDLLRVLWDEGWSANLMRRLLNWSALGLVVAGAVHFARQKRFDLVLLTVIPVAVPLYFQKSIFDAASMARYALMGFPLFVFLARVAPDGAKGRAMDSAFQMLQLVLAINFATARWAE